jgi:integrase
MALTKLIIRSSVSTGREQWLADDTVPGFGVRVTPAGAKSFVLRYRTRSGASRRMVIGSTKVMTLDQARDRARTALVMVRDGQDPRKQIVKHTMKDLAARFLELHRPPTIKAGTWGNYDRLFRLHILPHIGKRRVADIDVEVIQDLQAKLRDHPVNANKVLKLVSQALIACEVWGWRPRHTNPVTDVRRFKEAERTRILTDDEISRLMAQLDKMDRDGFDTWSFTWLVRVLLLSGLRCSEWGQARWEWVSFEKGTLSLPDSKTGARVVHLSDAVLDVLRRLKSFKPHITPWVFPNMRCLAPLNHPQHHWGKMRKKIGLDDVRIHDLRHTLGSLGHMAGLSQRDIADMLGHRKMATTERYVHGYDERKRRNAQVAAERVLASVKAG